jgi:transcriptional regulator with XRE-family HTH domain
VVEAIGPGFYRAPEVALGVGRAVRAYRTARGLTQEELAKRLLLHLAAVSRLEAGEQTPDLETLVRLARHLGLSFTVRITPAGTDLTIDDGASEGA